MREARVSDDGLGIVEIIIGMFLLAVIAVALLPTLWQGIIYSSQQSATATATRHLNALIEEARANPTCGTLGSITAADTIPDGKGADLDIAGNYDVSGCAKGAAVPVTVTATDSDGVQLAQVYARVYIP
jgi:Tfp pilus assembly protein PilV